VTLAVKENGWDGNDDTEEAAQQWSFAGALLYAVTVITTIGRTPPTQLNSSLHCSTTSPSFYAFM